MRSTQSSCGTYARTASLPDGGESEGDCQAAEPAGGTHFSVAHKILPLVARRPLKVLLRVAARCESAQNATYQTTSLLTFLYKVMQSPKLPSQVANGVV
jgi:hypothetical protein